MVDLLALSRGTAAPAPVEATIAPADDPIVAPVDAPVATAVNAPVVTAIDAPPVPPTEFLTAKAVAGSVTMAQVIDIAKIKMKDLNTDDVEAAARIIAGSARSMGLRVTE